MRKFIALAVVAAIVFSAASPTLAQRTPRTTKKVQPVKKTEPAPVAQVSQQGKTGSFADFDSITAVSPGSGTMISWTMRSETKVGFYQVYRLDAKAGRVAVGLPLIGSGAKTNFDTRWGESYSTFDVDGAADSIYEIEAVDLSGARLTSSQFTPKFQKGAALAMLSAVEQAQSSVASGTLQTVTPTVSAPTAAPNLTMHRFVVSQPGARISVRQDGLYRISTAELQAANFFSIPGSTNSANWRLFMEGNEQPIVIGPGGQYFEFYGRAADTTESDTRVYYLIADTSNPGLRMGTRVMRSFGGTAVNSSFRVTSETRERVNYLNKIFNGDTSNYWGNLVTTGGYSKQVYLPNVDTASQDNVTISVRLQGYSSTLHNQQVILNGHLLNGTVSGAYQDNYFAEFTGVSPSWLVDGLNSFFVQTTPTNNSGDYCVLDTIKVTYTQKFKGYQNAATVFTAGRRKVTIDGFSSPSVAKVIIPTTLASGPGATPTVSSTGGSAGSGSLRLTPVILAGTQPNPNTPTGQPLLRVARITVSRVFGSTGAVSADLNFTNGTAVGGSACGGNVDYVIPASPTVTLADGQVAKDVDIQICSGTITDPAGETFTATLSNPVGASLAASNLRLFDLSYDTPQLVSGATPVQNGNNFGLVVPAYRASTLYAVDESFEKQAAAITYNNPSTLSSTPNTANMLIITHSSLMQKANEWADYRRSSTGGSFNVKVVDVEDIYDEFSYGTLSSNSIKDYLNYAYTNGTQPSYALLFGDASYDPRNYEGHAIQNNLVPTKLVDLIFDESPSDEALADFNGDGLADIPIGRIPVISLAAADLMFTKMKNQELPAMQSFSRGAVFVNDGQIGYDFRAINESLRNELTNVSTVVYADRQEYYYPTPPSPCSTTSPCYDDVAAHTSVMNALNTGGYIVNYSGHGALGLWASTPFFSSGHVAQLTNPNPSIYTMLTCLNGLFDHPVTFDTTTHQEIEVNCLAETLLRSTNGGSSISWASATETTADVQQAMALDFYRELNAGNIKRVGDLIKHAKGQLQGGSDVRFSWALLGDPATKVRP